MFDLLIYNLFLMLAHEHSKNLCVMHLSVYEMLFLLCGLNVQCLVYRVHVFHCRVVWFIQSCYVQLMY